MGYEGSFTLVAPAMALSVVDVFPDQFDSLYFGVTCDLTGINPEVRQNSHLLNIKCAGKSHVSTCKDDDKSETWSRSVL